MSDTESETISNAALSEPLLPDPSVDSPLSQDSFSVSDETHQRSDVGESLSPRPSWRGLLFFKTLYFLNGLSASTWGRFGIIYYNQVCHLGAGQIGWLSGVAPLVSLICMPCWGWVADVVHSRKYVYVVTKFLNALSLLALALGPPRFDYVLMCVVGLSVFRSSGVLDAHCLDFLGSWRKEYYGAIRLWTAVSWGMGATIMGWLTDHYGFVWNFGLFGLLMGTMILAVSLGLPARSQSEAERFQSLQQEERHQDRTTSPVESSDEILNEDEPAHVVLSSETIREQVGDLVATGRPALKTLLDALLRPLVLFWLLQVILIGTGMALVDSFLFVFLQNDLQASTTLCGATVGVTVLFELPIFQYSEYWLRTLGHDGLFATSMVAYIVRAFGYTFLTPSTVHWILALEILHGITFASMWIASVEFAAEVAPPEWATTVQTILSASFGCVGAVLGSWTGGWVLETYSAVIAYRGMGTILAVVLLCHLLHKMWQVAPWRS